jgi:hypothetical protein
MKKIHKKPGPYPLWRRGIVLLALFLFAGCPQPADTPKSAEGNLTKQPDNSLLPAITAFSIEGIEGIIDEDAGIKTITLTLPAGTDLGSLAPTITPSDTDAVLTPASGSPRDFTQPVEYTIALDDMETTYRVTVSAARPGLRDGRSISSFRINGVAGAINETAKTITLTLPFGTNLKALAPEITLSDGATAIPASGVAQNFANSILMPKKYKVTAENGMQAEYKVTVQTASQNSFVLALNKELKFSAASVSIPRTAKTATVSLPDGYERYQWTMDGEPAGTDSRTITLKGEDYFIGSHCLGATAWQNGIPYYGELIVTVTP